MTAGKRAADSTGWLHRFAVGTSVATWLLVLAGALVTSNDAGLAVPDWPLSYGTWMPPMVGGIFYEHGHRLLATFVGLLTIILALWLWRTEARRWVRWLGLAALLAVIVQGILGGITVLYFLPAAVSVAHACLAQFFFCATISIALVTSPTWKQRGPQLDDTGTPPLCLLSLLTSGIIFLQLVLGALLRHGAIGLLAHVVGAVVVSGCVGWTVAVVYRRNRADRVLGRTVRWLLGLLIAQLLLGAASYWTRLATKDAVQPEPVMVVLTVLHVTVGALLLAASVVLLLASYQWLRPVTPVLQLSSLSQKAAP